MNEKEEIEIERWDIKLWTPPKRIIPIIVHFIKDCKYCNSSPCQCSDWFGNI